MSELVGPDGRVLWSNPSDLGHFGIKLRKQIAEEEMVTQMDERDDPDPCSIPLFAQCADWALRLVARICRGRCREHDACYARGGTLDDKLLADMAFCVRVREDLIAAGEPGLATPTAAAVWRGLQSWFAYNRWTFPPPAVERSPQEGP